MKTAAARILACVALLLPFASAGQQQPLPRVETTADGPFVLGRADAPVTFIEYVDYACSFCRRFHRDNFERLRKEFVDTGKVRYVVRDFPMEIHKDSVVTARGARCAAQQGKFWEMHHALLTAPRVDLEGVIEAGRGAQLDAAKLRDCVVNAKVNALIKADRDEALRIKVEAAPSFLIGRRKGDRVEGVIILGAKPYELYQGLITALLEAKP